MTNSHLKLSSEGVEGIANFEGKERPGTNTRVIGSNNPIPPHANVSQEDPNLYYSYLDASGYETIGIGHLLTDSEKRTGRLIIDGNRVNWRDGLTNEQVLALKKQDSNRFEEAVRNNVTVPLTQSMFDALVSWSFNVGAGVLSNSGSTLFRKLQSGDYYGAANELPRWNKSNGRVLRGLTRRRNWEKELFLRDIDQVENGDNRPKKH